MWSSVGIIGHGDFGAFMPVLFKRFAPDMEIRIYSRDQEPDGKTFFTLEETCAADVVIPAVPIAAFEETLERILPLMSSEAVLVDISTVKMHTIDVLKRLAPDRRYLATHPMFGPESYAKREGDISNFRIVLAGHTLPAEEYAMLLEFLRTCGFMVVETTPEEHDKHLAETLFLTHFIGQIIKDAGFARTEIDTVSFGFLMDAVESVRNDTQLFQDVYRFNPFCREVLEKFQVSEVRVRELLEGV